MTTERAIVKAILAYLNSLPVCLARKRWGGGMGVAGDPDIDACIRGRSLQLEVKRPGEKPTALQVKRIDEWRRAGAIVAVVNSVAEVRDLLDKEFH
ncbi:MAG TPA: VRR-NUC domain-containing protein [Bryobacteraceae bacterium]|nr:VRR-NUC domain-containing protein [Bryobacteraceae bacterium]